MTELIEQDAPTQEVETAAAAALPRAASHTEYVPEQDPIAILRANGIKVLTATGGSHEVREDLRDVLCLTSDMVLTVTNGLENDSRVLAFRDQVRRKGEHISRIRRVPLKMLRRLYSELSDEVARMAAAAVQQRNVSSLQMDVVALIRDAVSRGASDIHIESHKDDASIAFRIDDDLYRVRELPGKLGVHMCSAIYQSMCSAADEMYKPSLFQDARIRSEFVQNAGLTGSRVASGPVADGARMVIRLLYDSGRGVPSLRALGYLPEQIALIDRMCSQVSGINVLSGATGSGKSTTIVSVLNQIIRKARASGPARNDRGEEFLGISVVTIEDPPEYVIYGATQIPLGADKSDEESIRQAWANAITACMRQDPDIMMIGEVRDAGSATAASDAAATGHGVWTTLHTTDALGIMTRLDGLGIAHDRLFDPELITGLVNQSLVQRLCPHCSVPWLQLRNKVQPEQRARIERYAQPELVRLRGPGCSHCKMGITGRMVVAEAITPNLKFMEKFAHDGKAQAKQYWVRELGGITKNMALIRRINEGLVDPLRAEYSVGILDRDLVTMGLDYSHSGDFARGRELVEAREKAQELSQAVLTREAQSNW